MSDIKRNWTSYQSDDPFYERYFVGKRVFLYNCKYCKENHVLPVNGFASCLLVTSILSEQAFHVYRNPTVSKLEDNLNLIEYQIIQLHSDGNKQLERTRNHFISLRNDLNNTFESTIFEINEIKAKMLKLIDENEDKYVKQFDEDKQEKMQLIESNDFVSLKKKVDHFLKKTREHLKNFQIDETLVKKATKEAELYSKKLEKQLKELINFSLDKKFLLYKKPVVDLENVLGTLYVAPFLDFFEDEEDLSADYYSTDNYDL